MKVWKRLCLLILLLVGLPVLAQSSDPFSSPSKRGAVATIGGPVAPDGKTEVTSEMLARERAML